MTETVTTTQLVRRVADVLGYHHTESHEPSLWLRNEVRALLARPLWSCGHRSAVLAALWRPGTVTCADCLARLTPTGEDDFTCDRCGAVEHPITACAVAAGPLFVSFGLCSACAVAEYGEVAR